MGLFSYNPIRYIRNWFTQVTTGKDRFVKGDKPTQTTFEKLFNSAAFILDRNDRAKEYTNTPPSNQEGLQGLVVKNTNQQVKNRKNPVDFDSGLPYSYAVDAENLPDVRGIVNDDNQINTVPSHALLDFSSNLTQQETIAVQKNDALEPRASVYFPMLSKKFINWLQSSINVLGNKESVKEWSDLQGYTLEARNKNGGLVKVIDPYYYRIYVQAEDDSTSFNIFISIPANTYPDFQIYSFGIPASFPIQGTSYGICYMECFEHPDPSVYTYAAVKKPLTGIIVADNAMIAVTHADSVSWRTDAKNAFSLGAPIVIYGTIRVPGILV